MSRFVVDVSDLLKMSASQKPLRILENTGPLVLGEQRFSFLKPVELNIVMENIRSGILVKGSAAAELETECSRCLTSVSVQMELDFEEVFTAGRKQAEELLGKEEAEEAYFIRNETIDLEPAVRQALILSLPIRPLCSEACKGLCPYCGQNLNIKKCDCKIEEIDVRMEKLKKLLDEKENN